MFRLVAYLLLIAASAAGLGWLADRPGVLRIEWQGNDIETSVFSAVVALALTLVLAIMLWSLLRTLWHSPAALGQRIVRRRQKRGYEALSAGMIAVGAGDKALATRYALQARKSLPHEPMTQLLRAQAAQLSGDRGTARRIFESMLASPETEQLGLRGLFLEAEREGELEAASQFAERALSSNAKLGWSSEALLDLKCKQRDWASALETLALAKRNGLIEKTSFDRKRAVLLAAQALDAEENEPDKALTLALDSHNLAPDLVPAAAVAARILAGRGQTGKAAKVVQKTWSRAPHPDLATAYAHARIGDSPRDRLDRVRQLLVINPQSIESAIAVATTAIDARLFPDAREVLKPLLGDRLTQRVATLMARIEAGESDDKGRVREWLARAVNAGADPAWTADGVVSDKWEPISPVTGALDAFQWRVPVDNRDSAAANILGERLEELLAISAPQPASKAQTSAPSASQPATAQKQDDAAAQRSAASSASTAPPATASAATAAPPAAGSAPIRRNEAVDAEAVTVRPAPTGQKTSTGAATPGPASGIAIPPAAPAKAATEIEAKTIQPLARGEVSIVKPQNAASEEAKSTAPHAATKATGGTAPVSANAAASPAAPSPATTGARPATTPDKDAAKPAAKQPAQSAPPPAAAGPAKGIDPKIFVAPRAPDDPGPDSGEGEEAAADALQKRIYRAVK